MSIQRVKSICEDCGTIGMPIKRLSGAFWIEVILYLTGIFFIPMVLGISLPILISYSIISTSLMMPISYFIIGITLMMPISYSIRRFTLATMACSKCSGKMIDITTPRGVKLIHEMGLENIVKKEEEEIEAKRLKEIKQEKSHFKYTSS